MEHDEQFEHLESALKDMFLQQRQEPTRDALSQALARIPVNTSTHRVLRPSWLYTSTMYRASLVALIPVCAVVLVVGIRMVPNSSNGGQADIAYNAARSNTGLDQSIAEIDVQLGNLGSLFKLVSPA